MPLAACQVGVDTWGDVSVEASERLLIIKEDVAGASADGIADRAFVFAPEEPIEAIPFSIPFGGPTEILATSTSVLLVPADGAQSYLFSTEGDRDLLALAPPGAEVIEGSALVETETFAQETTSGDVPYGTCAVDCVQNCDVGRRACDAVCQSPIHICFPGVGEPYGCPVNMFFDLCLSIDPILF